MVLTVKDELLKKLLEANGEPVSGQRFAGEFGLSRTAIWKYVQELEKDGYEIGSVRKKGYYLIAIPDLVKESHIQQHLKTDRFGRIVYYEKVCDSTQLIAHKLAQNKAVDGTLVVAEEQLDSKGRMARPWASKAYKGIWMSIVIRPELTPQQAPQITLVAAVALVRAIEQVTGLIPEIKWPNDLLINGKKIVGILTELQANPDRVKAIILGIGINVNQQEIDFPDELREVATSLSIQLEDTIDRTKLIATTLEYLEKYIDLYVDKGFKPIKLLWDSYSNTIGKKVKAVMPRETIEGIGLGITEEGLLNIRLANGEVRKIYSGDIEFT